MILISLMILIFLSILIISGLYFILNCIKINNQFNIMRIKNFNSYIVVLHYYMERAYDIIYKESILIYSMEGMRVTEEQFNDASKKFTSFVIRMIGPNLKESYISFYGDEKTLYFNIMEYFNYKYESDELLKATSNNVMDFDGSGSSKDNMQSVSATDVLTRTFSNSYNTLK